MSAALISLATDVVSHLNAGTYNQSMTAARHYLPLFELDQLATLRVTVVPRAMAPTRETRGQQTCECRIEVMVQKRIPDATPASVDPLLSLVGQLGDRLLSHKTDAYHCQRVEHAPLYAVEHLDEYNLFTSLLVAVYQLWRAQP